MNTLCTFIGIVRASVLCALPTAQLQIVLANIVANKMNRCMSAFLNQNTVMSARQREFCTAGRFVEPVSIDLMQVTRLAEDFASN